MESGIPGMREEAECLVRGFKPRSPGEAMSLWLPSSPSRRDSEVRGWGGDKGTYSIRTFPQHSSASSSVCVKRDIIVASKLSTWW